MELATTAQSGTIVAKDTSRSVSPAVRSYRRFLNNLFASTLRSSRYVFAPSKLLPPDVVGLDLSRDEIKSLNMLIMIDKKHSFWEKNLVNAMPFMLLSICTALFDVIFSTYYKFFTLPLGSVVAFMSMGLALIISCIEVDINNDIITNAWPMKLQKAINNLSIRGIKVPDILLDVFRISVPGSETIDIVAFRELGARDSLAMIRLADMLLSRSDSIDILTIDGDTSELLSRVHSAIENSPIIDLRLSVMDGL